MESSPATVFRFTAEGVDLEFAGTETFVEAQILRFRRFLEQAVGGPGGTGTVGGTNGEAETSVDADADGAAGSVASAPAPAASTAPKQSLDEFYAARPLREGRGAIQDRILLFIYYLQTVQNKREVSGDDILWCFQQLALERPKNLHNALGILKRKLGHLEEGSRRGLYALSPAGRQYVEGRFS